jgi:hypothetical protein
MFNLMPCPAPLLGASACLWWLAALLTRDALSLLFLAFPALLISFFSLGEELRRPPLLPANRPPQVTRSRGAESACFRNAS